MNFRPIGYHIRSYVVALLGLIIYFGEILNNLIQLRRDGPTFLRYFPIVYLVSLEIINFRGMSLAWSCTLQIVKALENDDAWSNRFQENRYITRSVKRNWKIHLWVSESRRMDRSAIEKWTHVVIGFRQIDASSDRLEEIEKWTHEWQEVDIRSDRLQKNRRIEPFVTEWVTGSWKWTYCPQQLNVWTNWCQKNRRME